MFDFPTLQHNTANPTLASVLFTVLIALLLGITLAFTYEKTSRAVSRPNHFLQALVLVTIVAAIILQAIGDSVARGLGMLGALSIIRFRTTVRSPRNIVFMFAAIASGIACGVLGYTIAIIGTLGFCLTAFALRLSSFSQKENMLGTLRLEIPTGYTALPELERQIKAFCKSYALHNYQLYNNKKKSNLLLYEYQLRLRYGYTGEQLASSLNELPEVRVISLNLKNETFEAI